MDRFLCLIPSHSALVQLGNLPLANTGANTIPQCFIVLTDALHVFQKQILDRAAARKKYPPYSSIFLIPSVATHANGLQRTSQKADRTEHASSSPEVHPITTVTHFRHPSTNNPTRALCSLKKSSPSLVT